MKKIGCLMLAMAMMLCICVLTSCDEGSPEKNTYGVTVNGVAIEIDAEAAAILSALGEWKTYDASPTCAFEGEDKVYGYGSFEIRTYTLGGKDYIHSVYLLDDSLTTQKGITIGSKSSAVTGSYGKPSKTTEGALIYDGEGMTLSFLIRDDVVTNIQYVKSETVQ